jgi:restriction system protein
MLGLDPVQGSEVKKSKDRSVAGSKRGEGWIVVLVVVVGGLIYLLSKGLEGDLATITIVAGGLLTVVALGGYYSGGSEKARTEEAHRQIRTITEKHQDALGKIYRQKVYQGHYGEQKYEAFDKEVNYFYQNIMLPELNISEDLLLLPELYEYVVDQVYITAESAFPGVSIDTIPHDPIEFEHWTASVLNMHGWDAQATQGSGDQGSDVVAIYGRHKCIIQCKLYRSPVGNKAVQEVNAAKTFFDGDSAVVVGKSGYTRSAMQLADKNGVRLIDVSELPNLSNALGLSNLT